MYGAWLKNLDADAKHSYFGRYVNDESIDSLIDSIKADITKHHLLIAENESSWVGVIHIAESTIDEVEFGITVDLTHRREGIGDQLISEAIVWSANRGYNCLFMHCVSWNTAIKRLCIKHGLEVKTESGESETKMPLPRASMITLGQEIAYNNRNVYRRMLQTNINYLRSISSSMQFSPN
jgi:RimJ/RimL family protein N-acetyltransferase